MKKIIAVTAVALIFTGCGFIKNYPTSVYERAVGGNDTALYNFENGTMMGLAVNGNAEISNAVETGKPYAGNYSVKIDTVFNTPNGSEITIGQAAANNLKGKTLSAAVWTPYNMFPSETAYGITFYLKCGSASTWFQSSWINMNAAPNFADGVWTLSSAATSSFTRPAADGGASITDADLMDVKEWGVKIGQGGESPNFSGTIYIDSINIQ